jgi:hypothetical protein
MLKMNICYPLFEICRSLFFHYNENILLTLKGVG